MAQPPRKIFCPKCRTHVYAPCVACRTRKAMASGKVRPPRDRRPRVDWEAEIEEDGTATIHEVRQAEPAEFGLEPEHLDALYMGLAPEDCDVSSWEGEVGFRICSRRHFLGMTLREIEAAGIPRAAWSEWEAGSGLSLTVLRTAAAVLACSVRDLVPDDDQDWPVSNRHRKLQPAEVA